MLLRIFKLIFELVVWVLVLDVAGPFKSLNISSIMRVSLFRDL